MSNANLREFNRVLMQKRFRPGKPTALALALFTAHAALAQPSRGLEEIIVTAQKREQTLQEVPIAISALPAEALEVNRVVNVMDLGNMAPNLSVRETPGGIGVPNFTMRGVNSLGSVPGSDKPISMYLDGVYIGSTFGSAFELPDIERIEVLRGPQGTLFGRNATAGAISVITKDPLGEFAVEQKLTTGNYDQFRSSTRVDFPAWGPLSGSLSFTHNERTGDIDNDGAGATWNRCGSGTHQCLGTSPKTLGDQNSNSIFAALMYEQDNIKAVYKYDRMENDFTPEGTALVATDPNFLLGSADPTGQTQFGGMLFGAVLAGNPNYPTAGAHRPSHVNNAFSTRGHQFTDGHNLTMSYDINDEMSLKNIFAYRRNNVFANTDVSGMSGFTTPQGYANLLAFAGVPAAQANALVGQPWVGYASTVAADIEQTSDELQFTIDKDWWTVTTGLFYYSDDTRTGAPDGLQGIVVMAPVYGYSISGLGQQRNLTDVDSESLAAYTQIEVSITDEIDLLGGYRWTKDEKEGTSYMYAGQAPTGVQLAIPFDYDDSRGSYMLGANYHWSPDILLFAKLSTGFVSGGSVAGIDFDPETVKSYELGMKGDFLDRRLRANVALFKAEYKNIQAVGIGQTLNPPRPEIGTLVANEGDLDAQGVEVELTALPMQGLTLTTGFGYTDTDFSDVNPVLHNPNDPDYARPLWTGNVSAMYETEPLIGPASLMFNLSANYRGEINTIPRVNAPASFDPAATSDERWILNARIALREIEVAGANVELALWGRNLTDEDGPTFAIDYQFAASTTYERARTYGVDLTIRF